MTTRALNVFNGAVLKGRALDGHGSDWLCKRELLKMAKKFIAPKDQDAKIMKWAFEEIFRNKLNTEHIWKQARKGS